MGKYNFDEYVDRHGTSCIKYDFQKERTGREDLLPLWVADMDFKLPEEILSELHKRIDHGIFGYTDPKNDYFDAVSFWYQKRHGYSVDPKETIITPGIVYSIAVAIKAFTRENDSIIVQEPVYYPFRGTIEKNNRKCVNSQLIYNKEKNKYEIDFDDFEKKIVENDVKLFLLCSPHNPVGRVWSKEELTKLGEICQAHDVLIFADEIHSDFVYGNNKHSSFYTLGKKYEDITILGISPSKTFNIAGLQIANVVIKNKSLYERFKKENDAAGYSQGSILGMTATIACYTKGDKWFDELKEYLEGNIKFVKEFLRDNLPDITLVETEGTYLIWLDFSKLTDDYRVLKKIILDDAKLWLDPGIIFGKETALFERINVACPRITLEKAMKQLLEAVTKYKKGEE